MCEKAVEEMDVLTGIENTDIFGNISLPQLFDVICQERSCLAVHSLSWSTAYIFFPQLGKKRVMAPVAIWSSSIRNHFWHSCSACGGDVSRLKVIPKLPMKAVEQ